MPEGTTQTGYELVLRDTDGNVLEERGGNGSGGTVNLDHHLEDGATYTVTLRIRASNGMWSHPVEATFDVAYAPPPVANLEAEWDVETGSVTVSITHPAATSTQAEAVDCELWRLAPGEDWVRLATDLPLETVLVDAIPGVNGVNYYEVRTSSVVDSQSTTGPVAVEADCKGWVYVSGGPGFSVLAKIRDNASESHTPSRNRSLTHLAGPSYPVSISGNNRDLEISLSARLGGGSSTWDEWEAVMDLEAPLCYRSYTRREFVGAGSMSHQVQRIQREASLSFAKVHYVEGVPVD